MAIEQSKNLVRLFKGMKDYIIENQKLLISQKDYISLVQKVGENAGEIQEIKNTLDTMVTKADLSDFMKLFNDEISAEEYLILDGQPFKADLAYQKIYKRAKRNIIVIDDYLGIKTLHHIATAKKNIKITIISDNKGRQPLRKTEYNDYTTEYPGRNVSFVKTGNKAHDRYIVLDNDTKDMKLYHCGASSKDAGKRITTITRIAEVDEYKKLINDLMKNPQLLLK